MKKLSLVCFAVVSIFLAGCETVPKNAAHPQRRFRESAAADVVLHFDRWDTIQMLHPDSREAGFLPMLNREGVKRELAKRQPNRGLATVIIGFTNSQEIDAQVCRDWTTFLRSEGFRRIVILRAGMGEKIDGLLVLHDSAIAAADETRVAAPTALSPAAGAHVAYPSGN